MAQGRPVPGEKYLHFKKKLYQIIAVASHSETMEQYVVYQALYGDFRTYIRPYDMFISEVDHEKYPDVKQTWRFQLVDDAMLAKAAQRAAAQKETPKSEPAEDASSEDVALADHAENEKTTQVEIEKTEAGKAVDEHGEKTDEVTAPEKAEESDAEAETADVPPEEQINPWLDKFLDADTFDEKYQIICDMYPEVTDRLIDDIAVILDVTIPDGKLGDRYAELKYCARTRKRYESGRMH